jgi:hypothetical protein
LDFGFFGSYPNYGLDQRDALLCLPLLSLMHLPSSWKHLWGLITGQKPSFLMQFDMFVGPYTLDALIAGMQCFPSNFKLNLPLVIKTYSCKYIRRNSKYIRRNSQYIRRN